MKNKFLICAVMAFTLIFGGSLFTKVMAADNVSVFLNGTKLTYSTVQPQIISGRTMVPLSETAKLMGINVEWYDEIKTMRLTGGGRTVIHTLNQRFITVDGQIKIFDIGSRVANDYTLMPVVMLAEAIGAQVEWVENTKSVLITKGTGGGSSSGTPSTSSTAEVMAATTASSITSGQKLTFTIAANSATTIVRLYDTAGVELASTSSSYASGNTKIFTLEYTPTATSQTSMNFRVTPFAADNSRGVEKVVSVTINLAETQAKIISADVNKTSISSGETITVTVRTNDSVTSVYVTDKNGETLKSTTSYEIDRSYKVWTLKVTPKSSGTNTLTVYANVSSTNYDSMTLDIKVGSSSSGSGSAIISASLNKKNVSYNEKIKATVETYTDVSRIWVEDKNGNEVARTTSNYTTSGSVRTWTLEFVPDRSGTFYVYARPASGSDDYVSFSITVNDYNNSNEVSIINYDLSKTTINQGQNIKVTIYTSDYATKAWVEDSSGYVLDTTSSYSYDYSNNYTQRVWELTVSPDNSGYIRLYATDGYDDVYESVKITVN